MYVHACIYAVLVTVHVHLQDLFRPCTYLSMYLATCLLNPLSPSLCMILDLTSLKCTPFRPLHYLANPLRPADFVFQEDRPHGSIKCQPG